MVERGMGWCNWMVGMVRGDEVGWCERLGMVQLEGADEARWNSAEVEWEGAPEKRVLE